jgi:RimJ/RimL family protein N-acetyltransferase
VLTDVWPLFGLVLRTPRLELRLPSPEQLAALAELAEEGVHDPAVMPFVTPWTDLPPGPRGRSVVQYQWRTWAELRPQRWRLELAVLAAGRPLGLQGIGGQDFAVTREVATGSWLGRRHHGRGIGTEMRAAVLHLAFVGLDARWATSGAASDNLASIGVSRKLGYADDGAQTHAVRGQVMIDRRFRLDRAAWQAHRSVPVEIEGLEPCRELLGAGVSASLAP